MDYGNLLYSLDMNSVMSDNVHKIYTEKHESFKYDSAFKTAKMRERIAC